MFKLDENPQEVKLKRPLVTVLIICLFVIAFSFLLFLVSCNNVVVLDLGGGGGGQGMKVDTTAVKVYLDCGILDPSEYIVSHFH